MKYVNSLKYMNSFRSAEGMGEVSHKRVRELCQALGRINVGGNGIFIPSGASGHATAVMLECVIKSAGYNVGRITSVGGYDSRAVVYINGDVASIDDYNRAVAELKAAVIGSPAEEYLFEEVSFVLALLICKMCGCEYLIFEGTSNEEYSLDSVCAPYDLVVIPTASDSSKGTVKLCCDAIKRGAREVISGNQEKKVYDVISNACVTSGVRLNFTSKLGFTVQEVSGKKLVFSYGGRENYVLRSPSLLQRDCAMLVIESALAIRRDGVKLPWACITDGLSRASATCCFDVISAAPVIVLDSAEASDEVTCLAATFNEVFGGDDHKEITLVVGSNAVEHIAKFDQNVIRSVIVVGKAQGELFKCASACEDAVSAAKSVAALMREGVDSVCFGSVQLCTSLKAELLKVING